MRYLSGGMKRRAMIAKALSHEPDILFLDEPTAGVDVELRRDMWELVRKLRADGTTIILTTHYIEEAEEMADRVGVISRGELIAVDEKKSLMAKMGKKTLDIMLAEPMPAIPPELSELDVRLEDDGHVLCYEFDSHAERTGIASLMRRLAELGIAYKDLSTHQSSLEDIFVELVHRPEPGAGGMNVHGIAAIYRFEMARWKRTLWQSLITPVITTALYFVVFGSALGSRMTQMDGVGFGSFIVPGLTLLSVFMQSIFNASFGIYFPKFTGTIYELLSAPISSFEAVLAYVGAAVTKSVILALVTLATAALFVAVRVDHPLAMILFLVGISTGFCLFGFAIGVWAQNFEQLQIIPMLVITPLTFLGGAFYSVKTLHEPFRTITLFNPDRPRHQRFPLELLFRRRRSGLVERRSSRSRSSPFAWRSSPGCSAPATASSSKLGRSRALSWLARLEASAVEVLGDEIPVDDVRQHRAREIRPLVAIVDVISVLPHIEREQRHHALVNDRRVGIVERGDPQRAAIEHEPCPAVREMVDRFFLQLLEQRLGIAEAVLDQLGELAARLLTLRRARGIARRSCGSTVARCC